jgi:hypothetical protein
MPRRGRSVSSRNRTRWISAPRAAYCPGARLLFCRASNTNWERACVTPETAQQMIVRGLVQREGSAGSYMLTDEGRSARAGNMRANGAHSLTL